MFQNLFPGIDANAIFGLHQESYCDPFVDIEADFGWTCEHKELIL